MEYRSIQSSSSSSTTWKYDVFLSFRGEDTGNNFTGHLFAALRGKGIVAFKEDTSLERGEHISTGIMQAIEGSRVFIVIFSSNYAASSWCLDELVKIVDCTNMEVPGGQIVLPVYYDVDPSDVRRQVGNVGEAFAIHEKRFKQDLERVQSWRKALVHVANLTGWDIKNKPQHTEIEKIVERVINILGYKLSSLDGPVDMEAGTRLHFNQVDQGVDGRRIGKIFVSNKEIAKGSNGTIVFEGRYEGRAVAVKRLVKAHHEVAHREIEILVESDRHPNIVRWHAVEYDPDFVYLALERCTCSLDDLIQIYSDIPEDPVLRKNQALWLIKAQIETGRDNMQDLWKENGHPSPQLLKLMRDVVSGVVHLHGLGIIHRDLKPQNVLIIKERSLCAGLADMGISKHLPEGMSSLGHNATWSGTSGWQARERLLQGRQTRAVDLFSLGCVLFFCMTRGRHPFGDRFERDGNIVKDQKDLSLVEFIPEAEDLISCLLNRDPDLRPKAIEVLHHPLFWSSEMRLSFLRDTSDRVKPEESNSDLLNALESIATMAFGAKWDEKMEPAFINNLGRGYKFDSVRDLLRVIRNKLNHYNELPPEIQELIGPVPEGYNEYFASRFPRLLIEVYKVICKYCKEEEFFQRYFKNVD